MHKVECFRYISYNPLSNFFFWKCPYYGTVQISRDLLKFSYYMFFDILPHFFGQRWRNEDIFKILGNVHIIGGMPPIFLQNLLRFPSYMFFKILLHLFIWQRGRNKHTFRILTYLQLFNLGLCLFHLLNISNHA